MYILKLLVLTMRAWYPDVVTSEAAQAVSSQCRVLTPYKDWWPRPQTQTLHLISQMSDIWDSSLKIQLSDVFKLLCLQMHYVKYSRVFHFRP